MKALNLSRHTLKSIFNSPSSTLLIAKKAFLAISIASCSGLAAHADEFVTNGDFSANASSFSDYPGYTGGSNPSSIADFSATLDSGYVGLGGPGTSLSKDPFQPSNYGSQTTDPAQFAFIQVLSTPAGTNSNYLSQTIDLASLTTYTLSFQYAPRNSSFGNDFPDLGNVSIYNNGATVTSEAINTSTNSDFITVTDTFTTGVLLGATTLELQNTSDVDTTNKGSVLDFADVSVTGPAAIIPPLPEPGTTSYGVIGLGVALLLGMIRHRRASAL
jgi:hypothetical protein